jgi:hypothetical protein
MSITHPDVRRLAIALVGLVTGGLSAFLLT